MSELVPFEIPLRWRETGHPEVPLEARVFGQRWQLRVNNFPEESMYSLLIDGEEVGDLDAWPAEWVNPLTLEGRKAPGPVREHFSLSSEVERAHAGWVARNHSGPGRLSLDHKKVMAHLRGGLLARARLYDCDLSGCEIIFTDLGEAELYDCESRGFVGNQSQFNDARLSQSSFIDGQLMLVQFERVLIGGCDFGGALLDRANFTQASIRATRFAGARLKDARFDQARCEGCDFSGADFSREELVLRKLGSFQGAHFVGCDFRGANFDGRRLHDTVFERCKFAGVKGKPAIEGPYSVLAPDLSAAGDGSDVRDQAALAALWT